MRRQYTRSLRLWGIVALSMALVPTLATAQTGEPVKPYIVLSVDVSGSMDGDTGSGPPSCGGPDTRMHHANCAIQNIVSGYGDMVMALGRFRQTSTDNNCGNGCSINAIDCSACDGSGGASCTPAMSSADRFEVLVPLVDNNQADIFRWVDFACGTCGTDLALNPELTEDGWTPLGGALRGAKRYMQGLNTPGTDTNVGVIPYWTGPGDDPIRDDPLKNIFVSPGNQCRPYIVILLTDGDETCEHFSGTQAAATSLLTTTVDGQTYRIETKPIGFGRSPGDNEIEGIAHAGGATNGAGNEGFYAQNENELSQAIAQIISDAQKFELCNGDDDDCDLAVDEDFPTKGQLCDDGNLGICRGTGTLQCTVDESGLECIIDTPGAPAENESCNDLDDDCDGRIDEGGVCAGCSGVEVCDNIDNDCDGSTDEMLTRSCGTDEGECTAGIETCSAGNWENCTATGPFVEICDTLDNDCDGTADGFAEDCSDLPGGTNPAVGICRYGRRICAADSGVFGPCLDEVVPAPQEACDTRDNDCDGSTDEDTGGADCTTGCGVGTTECVNGALECNSSSMAMDETCNGFDDDCDGTIDEEIPDGGPCDEGGTLCQPGTLKCVGGTMQCIGGLEPSAEICDCIDNNCNGQIDEEPPALCAPGASCVECQCAFPCGDGEFPCPLGRFCKDGSCLVDPCFNVDCPPDQNGDQTQCLDGACVRSCDQITCPINFACRGSDGQCVQDDCRGFPERCTNMQFCVGGTCVEDPCTDVTCESGEYCVDGACQTSCANVTCADNQRCILGSCQTSPCNGACPSGQVCHDASGECRTDPCRGVNCDVGQACNPQTGECEQDPCLGVTCPDDAVCSFGTCYDPGDIGTPDAGPGDDRQYVSPGGRGCASHDNHSWLFLLLSCAFLITRRRQTSGGAQ